MYVWMWTEFWMKYVHNLGCFAARFMWSYSLGNLTLRTPAAGIWNLGNIIHMYKYTHTWMNMFMYIVYIHVLEYINTSLQKKIELSKKKTCMCGCMYGYMDWKITSKQSFEWNMYTTWDASLQDFVWSYSLGNLTHPGYFNPFWKYGLGTG